MSLAKILQSPPTALEVLGGHWDQSVRKAVAEASPAEFERLTVEQVWAVLGWSERCASVGLRTGEAGWLAAGACAVLTVQDIVDRRDREVVLELLAYAATELGKIRDIARGLHQRPHP